MRRKAKIIINKEKMEKELYEAYDRIVLEHKLNPIPTFESSHSFVYASASIIAKYFPRRILKKRVNKHHE